MNSLFLADLAAQHWAMEPRRLQANAAMLLRRHHGGSLADETRAQVHALQQGRAGRGSGRGSVAVIPIHGPISQRASLMTEVCGGTSTQQVGAALSEALADDSIEAIVLDVDSPGGGVFGLIELADAIYYGQQVKPILGIANSLSASAAFWLMSQCSECYAAPGGEVGSIGVWTAHEDWSKALEQQGVTTTLISAGKFKTEGNPYSALPPEARAFVQSRTDEIYGEFTRAVARGRRVSAETVRRGMGEGRVLGAGDSVKQGLVDGVATLSQVVQRARNVKAQPLSAGSRQAIAGPLKPHQIALRRRMRELQLLEAT